VFDGTKSQAGISRVGREIGKGASILCMIQQISKKHARQTLGKKLYMCFFAWLEKSKCESKENLHVLPYFFPLLCSMNSNGKCFMGLTDFQAFPPPSFVFLSCFPALSFFLSQ
jgi:hypothetical protein